MSKEEEYYIPKYLDTPERWLFWTIDEAMVLISPLFLGMMLSHTLMGLCLGIVLFFFWKRLKGTTDHNLAMYLMYWYLPSDLMNLKFTPPSYKRFYIH